MTLGKARSGWSLGNGSGSVTSSAAAPMRFRAIASVNASVSTTAPARC